MTDHRQHHWISTSFALALVLALVISSSAHPQSGGTSLRRATRAVNVNVVVTDGQGNPVKGLTKDDFTVLDGGEPQGIAFFSTINNEQAISAVSSPGPDTYTNSAADYGATPSVTVLLFDTLNSRFTSQGYGLHRVREFLRQIKPQDHVGIYVLGDDLKVVHDFTRDASDLVEAIGHYDETHSPAGVKPAPAKQESTGDPALDRFLSGKDNRYRFELDSKGMTSAYRRDKLATAYQMTAAWLEAIARQLSTVQGRKTVIWVTDGLGPMGYFFNDDLDAYLRRWSGQRGPNLPSIPSWVNGPGIERLVRLMNAEGVSVYPVSAEGLEAENLGFPGAGLPPGSEDPSELSPTIGEDHGPMLELARRTGGRAFYNRNDLETGIRRALDDSRITYELAYYPDHNKWTGAWRKIEIKLDRPNVTVLARSGYFALPDPRPVPPKNRFEFLSSIAASPVEATQLPLTVHVATISGTRGPEIDASVHINPQRMLTSARDGHWKGNFEVIFMQLGVKNKLLDATQKDIEADLAPKEYAALLQKGWEMNADLKFMSGATLLCVILHDKNSDAIGSVRIPLEKYAGNQTGRDK